MASGDNQMQPAGGSDDDDRAYGPEAGVRPERVAAAATALAAIDAVLFPQAQEIPFHEQSVLIKQAVIRLFGHG